ncbi:MAG: hypothetical protein QOH06_116 [Acidobacteriota bacterium]|jgi:hypothetical protein|nr:hypothetical protein [Acidobacteriota bacterium]
MRPRTLAFVCLALSLLGLAAATFRLRLSPAPVGDETTHVLMAQSLWEDGDLLYGQPDLRRAYRTWNEGPAGVTLLTSDGGRTMHYAEPIAWALAAAPAWALLGAAGLPLLNMALFLGMLIAAARLFQEPNPLSPLFLGGFFFASASFGYVFRASPEVFLMACVFFALLLWRRARQQPEPSWSLAGAGVLLAAACLHQPALALLGVAVAADLLLAGRWKGAALLITAGVLALGLLAVVQRNMTSVWIPAYPLEQIQRRSFEKDFPLETTEDVWQGYGKYRYLSTDGLRLLPRNVWYFLAGRQTGLIPYFPFALLALALAARDRSRRLLLAGIAAVVLLWLLLDPHRWHGGKETLGNARLAVLYPALLFLPGRLPGRWSFIPSYAAAGLWTLIAVAGAIVPPPPHTGEIPTFRALPLELTLFGGGQPGYALRVWPGGQGLWWVPRATFWVDENRLDGIWVRGASTSEIVLVSTHELTEIRFRARSLAEDNELIVESGAERVLVRFDSEGKRNGAPVSLALEETASQLGVFQKGGGSERIYVFTLTVSDGIIPARRLPGNPDPRYLGVFLDFSGNGP